MRGSVLAYSGSMGNAVRITNNNIYGNTAGISTDTISAGGHPGYPADSVAGGPQLHLLQQPGPVRAPTRRSTRWSGILPSGVGIFWAGHNNGAVCTTTGSGTTGATVRSCYRSPTSWSRPRATSTPADRARRTRARSRCCPRPAATASTTTTSAACREDFRPFQALYGFGNNVGPTRGVAKNGVDFWWDEGGVGTVTGNCWFDNDGSDGTARERDRLRGRRRRTTRCRRTAPTARRGRPREAGLPAVVLPRTRGRPAARAVRLVHAAAAAGLGPPPRRSRRHSPRAPASSSRRARAKQLAGPGRRGQRASRTRSRRSRPVKLALGEGGRLALLAALLLASCGGDDGFRARRRPSPWATALVGSVAPLRPVHGLDRWARAPSGWRRSTTSASRST